MTSRWILWATFACAACGSIDPPAKTSPPEPLTIRILEPSAPVVARGIVHFEVAVSGGAPDAVELLADGSSIATLSDPYGYDWDTAGATEGEHQITARATRGGLAYESDPVAVTTDRTAPTVVSRTPPPDTSDYFVHTPLVVVFSEAIAPETVTDSSVAIVTEDGLDLAKSLEPSADGTTLTLQLLGAPEAPARLTVILSPSITDFAGNPLAPPADAWTLDVPEWLTLGAPLSATGANAERPSIALDADGRSVVAWIEEVADPVWEVRVARLEENEWQLLGDAAGETTDRTVAVGSFRDASFDRVALAIESDGTPIVAWARQAAVNGSDDVVVAEWDGAAWQPMGDPLSVDGFTTCMGASLSLDGDAPVVAWTHWIASGGSRVFVRRWDGSSWAEVGDALTRFVHSQGPSPVVSGADPVVAFWSWSTHSPSSVFVWSWDGAEWSELGGALDFDSGYGFQPSLALGGASPVVAWTESNGASYFIHVSRWDGAWTELGERLEATAGTTYAVHPSLVLDGTEPVVAWDESDGEGSDAIHVRRFHDAAWESIGTLSAVDGVGTDAERPSLAVSADALVVAWDEDDGAALRQIHARRRNE